MSPQKNLIKIMGHGFFYVPVCRTRIRDLGGVSVLHRLRITNSKLLWPLYNATSDFTVYPAPLQRSEPSILLRNFYHHQSNRNSIFLKLSPLKCVSSFFVITHHSSPLIPKKNIIISSFHHHPKPSPSSLEKHQLITCASLLQPF